MAKKVAGIILAGGQSRRMGSDKSFVDLRGKALIQHVIGRVHGQVGVLAISTNSDDPRYVEYGPPLVRDVFDGFQGPLAGIHAGLMWLQSQNAEWLATFACDTPFVPEDCVGRLSKAVGERDSRAAIAVWNAKKHPTMGLWHRGLLDIVERRLHEENRKLMGLADDLEASIANFSDHAADPFRNINSEDDLASAEAYLRQSC